MAIVFGIGLFQIRADRVQIGGRLRRSDSRLQMPHRHEKSSGSPRAFRTLVPSTCSWFTIGTKKSGEKNNRVPWKLRRRHADDGKRMLVQLDHAAHHAAIILKMAVPIRVHEHDIRSAVGAVLIGGVEETAKIRLNAQHVEVVSAHFISPGA